jgi:hypothetical protein
MQTIECFLLTWVEPVADCDILEWGSVRLLMGQLTFDISPSTRRRESVLFEACRRLAL